MNLSEYLIESISSRKTGKYKPKLDFQNMTYSELSSFLDGLDNVGKFGTNIGPLYEFDNYSEILKQLKIINNGPDFLAYYNRYHPANGMPHIFICSKIRSSQHHLTVIRFDRNYEKYVDSAVVDIPSGKNRKELTDFELYEFLEFLESVQQ